MPMEVAAIILYVGFFVFLSHLLNEIFRRKMLPDVLILILIGLYIGPVLKIVSPSSFGELGPIFATLTLIVILFEGGVGLNILPLVQSLRNAFFISFFNFLITMGIVAAIAWRTTGLSIYESLLFGAILGATSSAVVIPIVQHLRIEYKTKTILILESTLSDVFSIVVSLAILEALKFGKLVPSHIIGKIISSFILSAVLGSCAAYVWSIFLNKIRLIKNSMFTTPSFVFVVYGIVELLGYSGAIAAFTFGVTMGNIELFKLYFLKKYTQLEPIPLNESEKFFFSEIVFLLKTFFFIYIGLTIRFDEYNLIFLGLGITATLFLYRIPIVRFSISKSTPIKDASLIAVIIPKGLVTIVLASIIVQGNIPGGYLIQSLSNLVVFFSIIFTSIMIFLMDKTIIAKLYSLFFSGFGKVDENELKNQYPKELKTSEPEKKLITLLRSRWRRK
jgi:potassium/hydrogen antiporter